METTYVMGAVAGARVRASAWVTGCLALVGGVHPALAQSEAPASAAPPSMAPTMVVSPVQQAPMPMQQPMVMPMMAAPRAPRPGEVIERNGEIVLIRGEGWHRGDRVDFTQLAGGESDTGERDVQALGSGTVINASADRARVRLNVDVRVPVGATAEHAMRDAQDYPGAPSRLPNVLTVAADARAFLPIGAPVGIGILGGVNAMYRFGLPIALRASIDPAGGVTSAGGGGSFSGHALLSLDTTLFEVGLGAGAMTPWQTRYANVPPYASTQSQLASFALVQFLRVGSIDGFMIQARSDVYVDSGNQFQFGNLYVMGQIPLTRQWWLQGRGGGGAAGVVYGEVAVRHLMWGTGDHDSFFLTGTVGGAGVQTATNGIIGGPSVGLGLEWRI